MNLLSIIACVLLFVKLRNRRALLSSLNLKFLLAKLPNYVEIFRLDYMVFLSLQNLLLLPLSKELFLLPEEAFLLST